MDTRDWLFSPSCALNEQISRQISDILPEEGLIMIIMDKEGHCWTSNPEEFSKLGISNSFFGDLFAQIDDGAEPVITQANECSIVATQLTTEKTNCGYVIIALPQYSPEPNSTNIDVIEALLNQTCLIAEMIENNNILHQLQAKQLSLYTQNGKSSN